MSAFYEESGKRRRVIVQVITFIITVCIGLKSLNGVNQLTAYSKHKNKTTRSQNQEHEDKLLPAQWFYHADCGGSMIKHHQIRKGFYGVRLDKQSNLMCFSRYYKLHGLFQALSDIAKQANVTMMLAYGTLLSHF
jgi:hypothetical protein